MLYEGQVRQVGTVEEIKATRDPIVRQFIEGRAEVTADNGFGA
jgi:ABC-type transporter Mla maintaining outer membrane lipid asymmetry ATPase subunit MlaF